jgi:hypothetical protein
MRRISLDLHTISAVRQRMADRRTENTFMVFGTILMKTRQKTTPYSKMQRHPSKPSNTMKGHTQDTGAIEGAKAYTHNRSKLPKDHKRPLVKDKKAKRTPYK